MNRAKRAARVAIVIPAFNEEEAIGAVISGLSDFGSVIVVDDGSIDNTKKVSGEAGALVISHEFNRGYDEALATGLAKAIAEEFDFAITLDADGQHEPQRIENFLFELMNGADLVIGIRDRYQRVSEKIFGIFARNLWGISDPLCGMKGYRLSKLKVFVSLCTYRSIGTELAIRATRSGWNIRQLAVKTYDRQDRSRFGGNLYANLLIFRAMLIGLLWARSRTTD
jgi:glycosyltransferase involved in cell wall biosynthesis